MRRKSDFVVLIMVGLPCAVLFTILFIGLLTNDYPAESELQYETCTYIEYEYDRHRYGKGHTSRTYKVYVEEYDTPLIIDNIVFTAVPEARFSTLKSGDKVTLSIEKSDDKLYLYALSADGYDILSYDEFLDKHNNNNKTGIYLLPFMIIIYSPLSNKAESEFEFEECTFISHEYYYRDQLTSTVDIEQYRVFVEEYDDYLILTNLDKLNLTALFDLEPGDKITVSINNKLGSKFLYSLSHGDRSISSYDDYLTAKNESDKSIHQISIFLILFALPFPLIEIIYKKVKGKILYWPDENEDKTKSYDKQNYNKKKRKQ